MKKLQSILIHQEYSRRQKVISCIILIVLAALLYWPTLQFGFVLDDNLVISNNKVTQGGADSLKVIWAKTSKTFQATDSDESKISRPLTQTYFAMVYDNILPQEVLAKRYHKGQIILYALLVWCLFLCLEKYFAHLSLGLRCIVIALFIAHPLHVEVVANIKSADELLASICFILSLLVLPQSRATSPQILLRHSLLVGMSFLLIYMGYKAKQNILMLAPINVGILLFGAFKYFSVEHRKTLDRHKWNIGVPSLLSLLGIALYKGSQNDPIIQFYARDFDFYQTTQNTYTVTQNTFLGMSSTLEIFANSLWITFLSFKNLIYPTQLIHQYGAYQIPLTSWQSPKPYIALVLALCLISGMIYLLKRSKPKKSTWIAIGIFVLPLIAYSHIFIPLPDTYADRFLFMAVLGFLLLLAVASNEINLKPTWILATSLLIGVGYTAKSVQRIPAWQSDDTLLIEDFRQSPNNASILARYASNIENDAAKKEQLYLQALAIYPNFFGAHYDLARLYFLQNRYALAYKHFNQAIERKASDDIQHNLELCSYHILHNKSQSAYASKQLEDAIQLLDSARSIFPRDIIDPKYRKMTSDLAKMYFELNAHDTAYMLLIKALEQDKSHLVYAQEGLNMAGNARNSAKAVEFGLYFAPSRADDSTYWADLERLAQGNKILLEQIKLRKSEIFSAR